MKNQFRFKILLFSIENTDGVCKSYVDNGWDYPSKNRNSAHVGFIDENLGNVRFVKVNTLPSLNQHHAPKQHVDDAIDEISFVRKNQDNNFNKPRMTNVYSIVEKKANNDKQVITKSYVAQIHQEIGRFKEDLGTNFHDDSNDLVRKQVNSFNNHKGPILDSIIINRTPVVENEILSNKMTQKVSVVFLDPTNH